MAESETVTERNRRHQTAYKSKRKADGFVYHGAWVKKKMLGKIKKLAVINEVNNDELLNQILDIGLKQYLRDDLRKD